MVVYGLKCSKTDTPVPLQNIDVVVNVQGYIAEVSSTMCYKNIEKEPIEAIFVFPVDDRSAVYKFQALIDGRLIEAECQEKEQANETYRDAIETGFSAFLLQESDTSGDVFECRVGNLPPNEKAEITFAYVIELDVEANGDTKFIYPCVLSPRYNSSQNANQSASGGASSKKGKTPPTVTYAAKEDLTYTTGLEIEVLREAKTQLKMWLENAKDYYSIYSDNGLTGKLSVKNPPLDQDLIVYIRTDGAFKPHVLLENGDPSKDSWFLQKDIAMVNFCPSFDEAVGQVKGEYIFIMDQSGSMRGESIRYAKKALHEFLDTLPDDCYFNIVGFGNTVQALFECGSSKRTQESMRQAYELEEKMTADLGGTNMMLPFTHIYSQPVIKGYPRQIFLITDDLIWNAEDLIALVKENQAKARVFTFGIGAGASTTVMFGIARAGRGRAEFITDDLTKLPEKVKRMLKCAMSPYVEDVKLHWRTEGNIEVTRIPRDIPAIFDGERLIVYGLIKSLQPPSQTIAVELTGNINGDTHLSLAPVTFQVQSTASSRVTLPIHRLAAKAQIKELQDNDWLSSDCPPPTRSAAKDGNYWRAPPKPRSLGPADRSSNVVEHLAKRRKSTLTTGSSNVVEHLAKRRKSTLTTGSSNVVEHLAKRRKSTLTTDKVFFVAHKDGSTYHAAVKTDDEKICNVEFIEDGDRTSVDKSHLVPASLLSPGDRICVADGDCTNSGLVLKYDAKTDKFCTAQRNGIVSRLAAQDMIIPHHETKRIASRKTAATFAVPVCNARLSVRPTDALLESTEPRLPVGLPEYVSTSDIAQLALNKDMNNTLVEFFLRYWTDSTLSVTDRRRSYIFRTLFFDALLQCRQEKIGSRYESIRPYLKNLDPFQKDMLIMPIFDKARWFVFVFRLHNTKPNAAEEPIRVTLSVIDSCSKSSRVDELPRITLLKDFLEELFTEKAGHPVKLDWTLKYSKVPPQENTSESGLCMLLCIQQCFKENFNPQPNLTWIDATEVQKLKTEMVKIIMALWLREPGKTTV